MPRPRRQFALKDAAPRWWVVLAALAALSAYFYFGRGEGRSSTVLEGRTMGTSWRVVVVAPPSATAALQHEIEVLLADIERSMSTFDPESELSRFNRHASREPFRASSSLVEVMSVALSISRASGGAFDPTVGPMVDAWGFGPKPRPDHPPSEAEIAALRERVGWAKVSVHEDTLVKGDPRLELDLSAIAKGYAVDRVALLLEERGYANHLVEIGGEVRATGRAAGGRRFLVGVETPSDNGSGVQSRVTLDRALATSGNYRNFYDLADKRVAHTLDPRTGVPVQHRLLSASVLHERCAAADAWATALMVVGPELAWELATAHGLEVLLLIEGEGGRIETRVTPGFAAQIAGRSRT